MPLTKHALAAFTLLLLALRPNLGAADTGLEKIQDPAELDQVHALVKRVFEAPSAMANGLSYEVGHLPQYGWQPFWLDRLKALELVGYFSDLEESRYFANPNGPKPLAHAHQDQHILFYQTEIFPQAATFSAEISLELSSRFARHLLNTIMSRNAFQDRDLIRTLAQLRRPFWTCMILQHVLRHPKTDTQFAAELISDLRFEPNQQNEVDYTPLAQAIASRATTHKPLDTGRLFSALYGQIVVRGEYGVAVIHLTDLSGLDCSQLLEADSTFEVALPGLAIAK